MLDLSNLKIAFLAGTLGQGGAERQLFYFLRTLKQYGAKPRLFCLTRDEYWETSVRELGVEITWIGRNESRVARLARLIYELKKDCPTIIQSQHIYTNIYAFAAARALGLREIGALRNDSVMEPLAVGRLMGKMSLRLPRIVAANSQAAISKAVSMGLPSTRLRLLRNVVDAEYFAPTLQAKNSATTIAVVGRLVRQKRVDRFLTIMARLRAKTNLPFRAVIAGDGPLRAQLEKRAADLGLGNDVRFPGVVEDPREIYRSSDILALTSDWEGSPNVILEAMASELPVVATSVGDVPEFIREGETGFLALPEDEDKLVAAFLELLQNPTLRKEFGRRARERVAAEHSPQQLPQRLQNLYEAVLA
jgi:glycosyltransferase involved in cell wall biosynthesis